MPKIIELTKHTNLDSVILETKDVITGGGVVVFPTETAYGLGVDATNDSAINKLFTLKQRLPSKPFHVIVPNLEVAKKYVEVTPLALDLAKKYLPGPLTLVLKKSELVSLVLTGGLPTLGIRIPAYDLCLELAKSLNRPYTATSANVSTQNTCYSVPDVISQFDDIGKLDEIDLILDAGDLPQTLPSTIVDATGAAPIILRKGPIEL